MKCKNCKKINAIKFSKYTSGEFCSIKCSKGFSTKYKRKEINKKVSESLKGRPSINPKIYITKECKHCQEIFIADQSHKNQIYCSKICTTSSVDVKNKLSNASLKRCSSSEERERLKNIGRKGGFGNKGYTSSGIYYQSNLEKSAFEYLESNNIKFIPHKDIPNSSKVSDLFLIDLNVWIELDGIDREKRKKWLGKDYDYWCEKISIYKREKLNLKIIKSLIELEKFLNSII